VSKKTEQLVEDLSQLTVLEMSELKVALEDKWGVTAAAPVAIAAGVAQASGGDAGAEAEEATDFQIVLEDVPAAKKIAVIKIVREITGLGLKEAKDLCESTPKQVKDSAPKAEADEIKKKFEEVGAKVAVKPV